MALTNTTDIDSAAATLEAWLATQMPGAVDLRISGLQIPSSSGMSAETMLFEASWSGGDADHARHFAARVAPAGPALFPTYDFGREREVMAAIARHTDVPVPQVEFYDDGHSGERPPIMVMPRIDGRVPSDDPPFTVAGWVLELDEDEQGRLYDNALRALAAIHGPTPQMLGVTELELGLPGQLAAWREILEWASEGDANPTLDPTYAWLQENRPPDPEQAVLCWGDARIGNIIFDDEMNAAAVLDWEMATVAAREFDLAWWLFVLRYYTEGIGASLPKGFPSRAETVARYEELTGARVQHVDFYEIFAAYRLGALHVRAAKLMIGAGLLPPDATMALNNPVTQLLSTMLALPSPQGAVQNFVGNR
jgi:aminoglycoside phosphotransferase (APT) family kinase protein